MKSFLSRNRLSQTGSVRCAGLLDSFSVHPEAPRHVVLIHGIWDTSRTMRRLESSLQAAGFTPLVITLTPNGGQRSLEKLGQQVQRQINKRIPTGERFSIVGFSMGGLVARSYLRQFGEPSRIETFVSIASPHRGTWMAWLDGNPGVRDMRPGSAFLASIDTDANRFSGMRWITIRTPLDLIILPSTSSALPWAENHSIPVLLHPLLVLDRRVIACVIRAVGSVNTKSARAPRASPHGESRPPQNPDIRPHR